MTDLNREHTFNSLSTLMRSVLERWSREHLHTMMPGIIDEYEPERRRARVRPALRLVMTGDTPGEDGDALERALAVNVPVAWPAGGGGVPGNANERGGMFAFFPLVAGDRGMLWFSERGLTQFKQTGTLSNPDRSRFFDESDATFYPFDWGHPQADAVTLLDTAAAGMQTYDGHTGFYMKRGRFVIKVGDSTIDLTDGEILIDADGGTGHVGIND